MTQAPQDDRTRLRLYVAKATPNSARAERNLTAALASFGPEISAFDVEIIDVFTHGKRAVTDGVIVTPTLIAVGHGKRLMMMGDLTDATKLRHLLEGL
jgi:circadian clock protein KaiB